MSDFNLLYTCRNSFELSSKFDILGVLLFVQPLKMQNSSLTHNKYSLVGK